MKQKETSKDLFPFPSRFSGDSAAAVQLRENPCLWEECPFQSCSGFKQSSFDTPPSLEKSKPWLEAQVPSLANVSTPLARTSLMSAERHASLVPPFQRVKGYPVPQGAAAANAPWPGPGHRPGPRSISQLSLKAPGASMWCRSWMWCGSWTW